VNFEGAQTNPIRVSPDGTRLFVVNTPDARVSVYDITTPGSPNLLAEIPVGIEPVSVNPRTADEAWVVNQESGTVSVVSVSKGIVTDTIQVKAEPMDVVFAGQYAFVSVSRSSQVRVLNASTHQFVQSINLIGGSPRALAVSPDGKTVYTAFALSGNHTTIITESLSPTQPPPTNPSLPPPPRVGLIVDASDPNWSWYVHYKVPDNDVAAIDTSSLAVRNYYTGVGTINLGPLRDQSARPLDQQPHFPDTGWNRSDHAL
jgi:YVTN family beta-propeller protein